VRSITFNDFGGGLDVRRGPSVSDANRLRALTNAYVTTGKTLQKRPTLRKVAVLEAGTVGLKAGLGKLNTFYGPGTISHANPLFQANRVAHPTITQAVTKVHFGEVFNGFLYVAAEYADGSIKHHYLDDPGAWAAATAYPVGTFRRPTAPNGFRYEVTAILGTGTSAGAEPVWPTTVGTTVIDNAGANQITWTCRSFAIVDTNCPNTKEVLKQQSKIYARGTEVVRFCKTNDPRDWTAAADAGFLATGFQALGSTTVTALGQFGKKKLITYFADGILIWDVDPNPALNSLNSLVQNIGTRYPKSPLGFAGDLFFLSDGGYRSIGLVALTDNYQDNDVGSAIDSLVTPMLTAGADPASVFYTGLGQWWSIIGSTVWVYSYSRTSKVAAWSKYSLPITVDAAAALSGDLYVRAGDTVYILDKTIYADDGAVPTVTIELPYVDFKQPSVLKQIIGVDSIGVGTANLQLKYMANVNGTMQELLTNAVPIISGSTTAPGPMTPVEMVAVAVAPVITHAANEDFRLDSLTFHYEVLGAL
jgi:hypothetical protein